MDNKTIIKNDNPVLNNAYEEPKYYYDSDINGNIDYNKKINGRRPYGYDVNIVPNKRGQKSLFTQGDFVTIDPNAEFINGIRKEVKAWREGGYQKSSRITKELLDYWFCNTTRPMNLRLFFCQREAVETAIWLNEIAEKDPNMGTYMLNELTNRRNTVSSDATNVLPRTAFKMATGTGKTVVMAMFILYNYLNKRANPMDIHYADHFLLCAPGITIRDRLSVLQLDNSTRSSNYDRNDYYHQRGLIPPQFEKELGGLNSSITIVNYQQFLPKVYSGKHESPLDGKIKWVDGKAVKQKDKEDFSVLLNRILEKGVKGKRIVVINDEAHHCYLPKISEEKLDDDEKSEKKVDEEIARVWYEGLRQMKLLGYKLQNVYDLSATPYYLKGSGYPEYSLFPWVVSDFGLVDAIESGLVKIPYLPAFKDNEKLEEPKLRNIYQEVRDSLPKKKDLDLTQPPHLPTFLNMALDQFVTDYKDYERGLRAQFESKGDLLSSPPVMIIVCNNTTVSREVYREIAGFQEGTDQDGNPRYRIGRFDVFSNYDAMNLPKAKFPTLLIDSAALDDASTRIDEAFKRSYAREIEEFKHEYANIHGSGSADKITDADILREVVNTVGKPGKLGGDIKCVVSVSMLTEGWDANTVTHVCGIRAFGSQLLCEQVVGRALRRQSYHMLSYDARDGHLIEEKDRSRYKKENIVYKFPPEYARVIGVPFNTFKGGESVVTPPQPPKAIIRALPDRQALEIKFPNITGYRSDNIEGALTADYTGLQKFILDFDKIPLENPLQTAVNDDMKILKTDYMELRDSQVVYYFASLMIRDYYFNDGKQFYKFGDVLNVVKKWYNEQIELKGGDGRPEQKRAVMLWDYKAVLASIHEGIHKANGDKEVISAILNYYNPFGSTSNVYRPTNRSVLPITKSHVNLILAEPDSWQEVVAKSLDRMDCVISWVRNNYLGFRIPYTISDETKEFLPSLIVRVKTPKGKVINLIVECQKFDSDKTGNADRKRQTLLNYWIPAANNLKTYGEWQLVEVENTDEIENIINEKIKEQ